MTERTLIISLNLEEGNLLLEALAECPFKSVFELIGKLNHQANHLFIAGASPQERRQFVFTEDELSFSLKALGNLPYHRVNKLLEDLNLQIETQCNKQRSAVASTDYVNI
ncbi:hypothetical protein [Nitrosomonas sp.]|uniref:hypothetical protein n=1 Tax=Nitrosomonas sp. TaxID=42353 RepID=UPI001DD6CED7|nr:hypothetical protein [Nitrosomonas sp.]MBX3616329.1 hypothetical protein [Nitrosomonas sp.]